MIRKILFALLFSFVCFQMLSAQTADEVLNQAKAAVNCNEDVSYTVKKRILYSGRDDTLEVTVNAILKKLPSDPHKVKVNIVRDSLRFVYNGIWSAWIDYDQLTAERMEIGKSAWDGIRGNYVGDLIYHIYLYPEEIGQVLSMPQGQKELLPSVTIRGAECEGVKVSFKDAGNVTGKYFIWWFSKATHLPVAFESSLRYQGLPSWVYAEFYDIKVNTHPGDDVFDYQAYLEPGIRVEDYKPYQPEPLPEKGSQAQEWRLPSVTGGDSVSLSDFRGKPVLIEFWYRSCAPCLNSQPALHLLHETYKSKGLVVLGLNVETRATPEALVRFAAERGLTTPVLMNAKSTALQYKVNGYPTFFLIDGKGKIAYVQVGYSPDAMKKLEKQILKALK